MSLHSAGLLLSGDQRTGYGQMASTALFRGLGSEECPSPSPATPGPLWTLHPPLFPLCHPRHPQRHLGSGQCWLCGHTGTCIFKPWLWPSSEVNSDRARGFSVGTVDPEREGWGHHWHQEAPRWSAGLLPAGEVLSAEWGLCPSDPGSPRELEQRPWQQGPCWRFGRRKLGRAGEEGGGGMKVEVAAECGRDGLYKA